MFRLPYEAVYFGLQGHKDYCSDGNASVSPFLTSLYPTVPNSLSHPSILSSTTPPALQHIPTPHYSPSLPSPQQMPPRRASTAASASWNHQRTCTRSPRLHRTWRPPWMSWSVSGVVVPFRLHGTPVKYSSFYFSNVDLWRFVSMLWSVLLVSPSFVSFIYSPFIFNLCNGSQNVVLLQFLFSCFSFCIFRFVLVFIGMELCCGGEEDSVHHCRHYIFYVISCPFS